MILEKIKQIIPLSIKENLKLFYYAKDLIYKPKKNHDPKCVVVFFVGRTNVFNSVLSVYQSALNMEKVSPYLLALPNRSCDKTNVDTSETVSFCERIDKEHTIDSYDKKSNCFFDIEKLNPDFIFLNIPYDEEYPDEYKFKKLAKISKLCFIPYGYGFLNGVTTDTGLNLYMLGHISYLFADGNMTYNYCRKKLKYIEKIKGKKVFSLGYPRFDLYDNKEKNNKNKHLTISYFPRWTSPENVENGHEPSSFFLFKDQILKYAEMHPNFQFIIRPHPIMFSRYIEYHLMTEEDVHTYKQKILNLPNLILDETPDYRDTILKTDILISDFSSTLAEFMITQNPVIFFGTTHNVAREYHELFESMYQVKNWAEAELVFEELLKGNDTKKEQRILAVNQILKSGNHNAGQKIIEFLYNEFRNKGN